MSQTGRDILDIFHSTGGYFTENRGQVNVAVRYYSRGNPAVAFRDDGVMFVMTKWSGVDDAALMRSPFGRNRPFGSSGQLIPSESLAYMMRFDGSNIVRPIGLERLHFDSNFFIGSDSSKWATDVPNYAEIVYRDLYQGIDLSFRMTASGPKYEFTIQPGADISAIRIAPDGVESVSVDADGVAMSTLLGSVRDLPPYSFQESGDPIACSFIPRGKEAYGFDCASWDRSRRLTIDPLIYSTFLGGSSSREYADSIAVDDAGSAYVTGMTYSADFPVTVGVIYTSLNGTSDAFVSKLSPDGSTLEYSTYLGGGSDEWTASIALDSSGGAYVVGVTDSTDYPTTPGAYDTSYNGGYNDIFVTELNPTGSSLLYSTYIGAYLEEVGYSIVLDSSRHAYITGKTWSDTGFPTTTGAYDTTFNDRPSYNDGDVIVIKLTPAGDDLVYSTFIGGAGWEVGMAIALDSSGNAFVTGDTESVDFPVSPGAMNTTSLYPGGQTFVAKLNAAGSSLVYSALIGRAQSPHDGGRAIIADSFGAVYVAGTTSGFSATAGAYQTSFAGDNNDGFLAKLDSIGSAFAYGTYLGGSDDDYIYALALDSGGNAYVSGRTFSADYPVTADAFDTMLDGTDAFLTEVNPTGSALVNSTFLGGNDSEYGYGLALDSFGSVYVVGPTSSPDFPVTADSFDETYNGFDDAFVTKLGLGGGANKPDLEVLPGYIVFSPPSPIGMGATVNINVMVHNVGFRNAYNIVVRFYDGAPVAGNQIDGDKVIPVIDIHLPVGGASVIWLAVPPRFHDICIVADPDNSIDEVNETNNEACAQLEVIIPPVPDLTILQQDVLLFPAPPIVEGSIVRINATVRNIGGVASGATAARFHDGLPPSPQIDVDQSLATMPSGGSQTVSVVWIALPPGSHNLCAIADPDNLVSELDEGNNMACFAVEVLPVTKPDYLPFQPEPPSPSSIGLSLPIVFSVVVHNQGNATTVNESTLAFCDEQNPGIPFAEFRVSPLLPGSDSSRYTATWTSPAIPGTYLVSVDVDYYDNVSEWDETNNVYTWTIDVASAPVTLADYVPTQTEPPTPLKIGTSSTVLLSLRVLNKGNATAQANATILAFYSEPPPTLPFAEFVVFPLPPDGVSPRYTAEWRSPAVPGVYSVTADVDYFDDEIEWNETDNLHIWIVEVVIGPVTSLVVGAPNYTSTATYVRSSTALGLSVSDRGGTGINFTRYRIDGGQWIDYGDQFFLAGEGEHSIEWYSEDNAGNREDVVHRALRVDDTPPSTSISPANCPCTADTLFTLTGTDSGSGVNVTRYRIDGGEWTVYTNGFTVPEGEHNISFYSVDNLNNTEPERWLVVKPPPEVAVNYKPIVALTFAIILLVAGVWSSKKRPWKGGKERRAVVKAFMLTSMPFVLAEAATGVVSFLTGQLSIPPLVGAGTAVDLAILLAGIVAAILRIVRTKPSGAGETGTP